MKIVSSGEQTDHFKLQQGCLASLIDNLCPIKPDVSCQNTDDEPYFRRRESIGTDDIFIGGCASGCGGMPCVLLQNPVPPSATHGQSDKSTPAIKPPAWAQ